MRDAAVDDPGVLLARQAEVAEQVGPRRRQDRLATLVHEARRHGGRGPAMARGGHYWHNLATAGHRLLGELWRRRFELS